MIVFICVARATFVYDEGQVTIFDSDEASYNPLKIS